MQLLVRETKPWEQTEKMKLKIIQMQVKRSTQTPCIPALRKWYMSMWNVDNGGCGAANYIQAFKFRMKKVHEALYGALNVNLQLKSVPSTLAKIPKEMIKNAFEIQMLCFWPKLCTQVSDECNDHEKPDHKDNNKQNPEGDKLQDLVEEQQVIGSGRTAEKNQKKAFATAIGTEGTKEASSNTEQEQVASTAASKGTSTV
ncbi:hypothetical protein SELMODRAFT_431751 [Selaginella moellendorffii]|uniref:Uncharacterized protein n=1 Tax=Selaginella moellendorffii TaxID=88036 RepID=D8TDN5_SELML|nr:hypothetical protein SELMODRAFT_431751 [Selaginella moellendorffii]